MTDETTRKRFARMLCYYLSMNSLTQADLARHMGVSTAMTAKWANGKALPRIDKIQRICDYLGIEKSDLLEEKEPKGEDEAIMNRLVKAASGCTKDQINRVIALLESFSEMNKLK